MLASVSKPKDGMEDCLPRYWRANLKLQNDVSNSGYTSNAFFFFIGAACLCAFSRDFCPLSQCASPHSKRLMKSTYPKVMRKTIPQRSARRSVFIVWRRDVQHFPVSLKHSQ